MNTRIWTCENPTCPVKTEMVGYNESKVLENILAAVRCVYCLQPLTPVPPPPPPETQAVKN